MNSLGGLFDLFSTLGVAYLKEYVTNPGKSDLFNSISGFNSATDCNTTSINFGKIVKFAMSYEAQPQDFAKQLPQDLVSDVIG